MNPDYLFTIGDGKTKALDPFKETIPLDPWLLAIEEYIAIAVINLREKVDPAVLYRLKAALIGSLEWTPMGTLPADVKGWTAKANDWVISLVDFPTADQGFPPGSRAKNVVFTCKHIVLFSDSPEQHTFADMCYDFKLPDNLK